MRIATFASIMTCVVCLIPAPGCSSTGSTSAGTTYKSEIGGLTAHLPYSLEKVHSAAEATLKEMEFNITENAKDAFQARLVGRGAGDKKHQIDMDKEGESSTRISVGVGAFGDKTRATEILNRIESRLR